LLWHGLGVCSLNRKEMLTLMIRMRAEGNLHDTDIRHTLTCHSFDHFQKLRGTCLTVDLAVRVKIQAPHRAHSYSTRSLLSGTDFSMFSQFLGDKQADTQRRGVNQGGRVRPSLINGYWCALLSNCSDNSRTTNLETPPPA
jgi:hypothetical protein